MIMMMIIGMRIMLHPNNSLRNNYYKDDDDYDDDDEDYDDDVDDGCCHACLSSSISRMFLREMEMLTSRGPPGKNKFYLCI